MSPLPPAGLQLPSAAIVRTTSDPALSGQPAAEHLHPATVHTFDPDTGRVVWSPAGADWIAASAPAEDVWFDSVSAAEVVRGRGFVPLFDPTADTTADR